MRIRAAVPARTAVWRAARNGSAASGLALLLAPALHAQPTSPLALGDAAYAAFDNQAALRHYLAALDADASDPEALWKAAQAYATVGASQEREDRDEAKGLYADAERLARRAVGVQPESPDAHFVLAMSLGRRAQLEGTRTRIRLSQEVRAEAERTLELDPRHSGGHHILGRWHRDVARLSWLQKALAKLIYGGVPPGASMEQSAEHFAEAIEVDPARPVHHLEYAKTLLEQGRIDEAREHLRRCLELPRMQWDDPEHQREASRLLARNRGESRR